MLKSSSHRSIGIKALALAGVLSLGACGGGGGGGGGGQDTPPSPVAPSSITLTGVVAKGRMGNATVSVLPVKTDGTVDAGNVLARGETDSTGHYATGVFEVPALYVVEVLAKACPDLVLGAGCSFHQDEKTGARQYLPAGFRMRAVAGSGAGAVVNVTPLSEMAVSAAEKAGGLTSGNVDQAMNMVDTLLGVGDINAVLPTTLDTANASDDEVRMAALLSAISGLASSTTALGQIGCAAAGPGTPAATKCVVEALASNARVDTYVGGDPAVAAALKRALDDAVAVDERAATLVAGTAVKLAEPGGTVPRSSQDGAVAKARAFFDDLTSTVRTLLDSGATPGQGAFLSQAHRFEDAVADMDFQADATVSSAQLLHSAVKLWTDYEHGGTATTALIHKTLTSPDWFDGAGITCRLKKRNGADLASGESAALVDRVACRADYTMGRMPGGASVSFPLITYPYQNAYHRFEVTKGAAAGVFNYTATARLDAISVTHDEQSGATSISILSTTCPQSEDGQCGGARSFTGTAAATLDEDSRLASLRINGDLPDSWNEDSVLAHGAGGANLARTHVDLTVALNGSYANSGLAAQLVSGTFTFSGGNVAYAADGRTEASSLNIGSGSELAISGDAAQRGTLYLSLLTPTTKLAGTLTAQRTADHGGTGSFTGALYNLDQDSSVPFISASLKAEVKGSSGFDPNQPLSASNHLDGRAALDAFITAPGHPRIRLIAAATGRQSQAGQSWGSQLQDLASGDYIIYNADGSTRRDVSFTVSAATANARATIAFIDAAHGIGFTLVDGVAVADLLVDGLKTGVIDTEASRLTFTNGDFMSLDFGTVLYSN